MKCGRGEERPRGEGEESRSLGVYAVSKEEGVRVVAGVKLRVRRDGRHLKDTIRGKGLHGCGGYLEVGWLELEGDKGHEPIALLNALQVGEILRNDLPCT